VAHSRQWCPERKRTVPTSDRDAEICPVCGGPFDEFGSTATEVGSTVVASPSSEAPQVDPFDVLPPEEPAEPFRPLPTPEPVDAPLPVAGWHTDPSGVLDRQRYWDGSDWTQRTRMGVPTFADAPPRGWEWKWLLFSFQGRAHRRHYWGATGVLWGALVAVFVITDLLVGPDGDSAAAWIPILLFLIPYFWGYLAVSVKRWHDRNKSGGWMFIILVPYIGGLWSLIELGMLEGTRGPNQYGSDPRGQGVAHQSV